MITTEEINVEKLSTLLNIPKEDLLNNIRNKFKLKLTLPKRKTLSSYILKQTTNCMLCGTKEIAYFLMSDKYNNNCLQSTKVDKNTCSTLNRKNHTTTVKSCKNCQKNLQTLSKDDLILLILNITNKETNGLFN